MIEHTLNVQNFQHVYEVWPTEIFAWPGHILILSWLQFKTMYLYASKTSPIQPFDMISSSKQVFYSFWTRLLHIQKSKNILFWPSYSTKPKLDDLLVRPNQKINQEQTCCHVFFWKNPGWLLLSMQISTTFMLQSNFFKEYFLFNFLSRQPLVVKREDFLIWSLS